MSSIIILSKNHIGGTRTHWPMWRTPRSWWARRCRTRPGTAATAAPRPARRARAWRAPTPWSACPAAGPAPRPRRTAYHRDRGTCLLFYIKLGEKILVVSNVSDSLWRECDSLTQQQPTTATPVPQVFKIFFLNASS